MVLTSMLMSMSILSLKLEFENVLMSMLIVNPEKCNLTYVMYDLSYIALFKKYIQEFSTLRHS